MNRIQWLILRIDEDFGQQSETGYRRSWIDAERLGKLTRKRRTIHFLFEKALLCILDGFPVTRVPLLKVRVDNSSAIAEAPQNEEKGPNEGFQLMVELVDGGWSEHRTKGRDAT